jgi:CheY-like chemotaxis protein
MFVRTALKPLPLILLIDDDLVSREVTATLLTMLGYTVYTAEDGAAALALLTAAKGRPEPLKPDAILMDAQMPGISGTELIAELRARSQAHIIVVSGSNPPPQVTAAADGFLLKPFSAEILGKLLESSQPESAPSLLDANDPVVSEEVLAQFRKLMPEPAVRKVYEAVVADLGRRIDAVSCAMAKGDTAELRRIGHSIKGGCGMAGALEAARLGALLESGAIQEGGNQLDNREALLRDLRTAARRLKNMLDAEMPA